MFTPAMDVADPLQEKDEECLFKAISDVIRWSDETCTEVQLFNRDQNKQLVISVLLTALGAVSGVLVIGPLGSAVGGFIGLAAGTAAANQIQCSQTNFNIMFIVYTMKQMSKAERNKVVERVTQLIGDTSTEALKSFASTNLGMFCLLIVVGFNTLLKVISEGRDTDQKLKNVFCEVSEVLIQCPSENRFKFLTKLENVIGGLTFKQFVMKCTEKEKEIDEVSKNYREKIPTPVVTER